MKLARQYQRVKTGSKKHSKPKAPKAPKKPQKKQKKTPKGKGR